MRWPKRRLYIVWHDDSPGTRVMVIRRFRPRSGFSRIGEWHLRPSEAEDMTRCP